MHAAARQPSPQPQAGQASRGEERKTPTKKKKRPRINAAHDMGKVKRPRRVASRARHG